MHPVVITVEDELQYAGGVESVPSNVFVEAVYHGVKLPAKLY